MKAFLLPVFLLFFCLPSSAQTFTFGPELGTAMVFSDLNVEVDTDGIFQDVNVQPGYYLFLGAFLYYELPGQIFIEGSGRLGQEGRTMSFRDKEKVIPFRLKDLQFLLGRKFGRIEFGAGVNYLFGRMIDDIDTGADFEDSEFMEINRHIESELGITLTHAEMHNESIRGVASASFDFSWGLFYIRYMHEVSSRSFLQFDEGNSYATYDRSALAGGLKIKLNK